MAAKASVKNNQTQNNGFSLKQSKFSPLKIDQNTVFNCMENRLYLARVILSTSASNTESYPNCRLETAEKDFLKRVDKVNCGP